MSITEPQTGRILPPLPDCNITKEEGFKRFREALSAAKTNAQDALDETAEPILNAIAAMEAATSTVDKLLAQNPDPTTPDSTASLAIALGGLSPTADRETLEIRVAEICDLNVVNGVLLPKGKTKLGSLRRLFQACEINAANCVIPDFSAPFIFVTAVSETIETVVGRSCGEDIVEFTVQERKLGNNISVASAAKIAGVPENQILIRFFWHDEVRRDQAIQLRLKALGLVDENLAAVIMAPKEEGNVFSTLVDTSIVSKLKALGLTDEELCELLSRKDTNSGIDLEGGASAVLKTIQDCINKNTSNRGKAGVDTGAITPNTPTTGVGSPGGLQAGDGGSSVPPASNNVTPAGRATDPKLLIYGTTNLARSLGLNRDDDGDVTVDGNTVDTVDLNEGCIDILAFANEALNTLEELGSAAQAVVSQILAALALGNHTLSLGIDFASCLVALNLGLDLSSLLSFKLPFEMSLYLAAFTVALAAVTTAALGVKAATCIPQAVIEMLFGGVCGFKPFDFGFCPPDVQALIDRVRNLLNLISSMVSSIISALQVMKVDIQSAARASAQLKVFNECAIGATPMGIALGLAIVGTGLEVAGVTAPDEDDATSINVTNVLDGQTL